MAFTFNYNGISSSQYGIYATGHDFFNPPKRQSRKKIDFRHGSYDFEAGMYENRILTLNCFWKDPKTRHDIREITLWLSRKGRITLDIEPDKHYIASLYDASDLEPFYNRAAANAPIGKFNLSFNCDPFAYSQQTNISVSTGHTAVDYRGTASTPTMIILRNTTTQPIRGVEITALSLF